MAMKATPKHSSIAIKLGCARCLFRSATPFKLEIVQITSERVSHLGSSAFAPVGRGTADHPDRDRQRDKHTADRRPDRQTRLHGQPRNCIASMFVGRVRQCFSAVSDGLTCLAGERPVVDDEQARVAETLKKLHRGDMDIVAYEDAHKFDGNGNEPA